MTDYPWLEFTVKGTPAPQGSKRAYVRGDRVSLVETSGAALKAWRTAVTADARAAAAREGWDRVEEGSVEVNVLFWLPRPKSRATDLWHAVRPDVDKLTRAVLDALTTAGLWRDDCQVSDVWARKAYGSIGHVPTGAMIAVRRIPS